MKGEMVFELKDVTFGYPHEDQVLDNVDLNVMEGERLCILGANGSGKTTLLKMLAGLLFPAAGTFSAFGMQMDEKLMLKRDFSSNYHKRVGFIFQNSDAQLFCSTVKEEVAFGLQQLRMPGEQIASRVSDMLAMLGIGHLADKAPFKLSGGEKKRVALASILALNPEVLILDEPTNGLDPRSQRWLVGLLLSLNSAGKTVITSTHNLELVQEISERAVVFSEEHRIAADGSTSEVLRNIELLKSVNLVDEYYHMHGDQKHTHFHIHNF